MFVSSIVHPGSYQIKKLDLRVQENTPLYELTIIT